MSDNPHIIDWYLDLVCNGCLAQQLPFFPPFYTNTETLANVHDRGAMFTDTHLDYEFTSNAHLILDAGEKTDHVNDSGDSKVNESVFAACSEISSSPMTSYASSAGKPGPGISSLLQPVVDTPPFTMFFSNGIKYYRCHCGHVTRRRGDLMRHYQSLKHAQRQYSCFKCRKRFTRKDGLKRHEGLCGKGRF